MFLNSCILLVLACSVKAAVIVNVYEDGEVKVSHSLRDCDPRQCDGFCRSIGFIKGSCVGNKCSCTSFAGLQETKANYAVRDSCNYQACDQLCRRLGFPGGVCVGDKCECDNFELITIKGTELNIEVEDKEKGDSEENANNVMSLKDVLKAAVGYCDIVECDDMCRRLNFAGGTCMGGSCQCY